MPPVLPDARAPRGDVRLHGGDDVRTQARHGVEHPLGGRPIGQGTKVPAIEEPPLLPRGQVPNGQAGLGQDGASVLGGAPLEGPIGVQAPRDVQLVYLSAALGAAAVVAVRPCVRGPCP